MNQEGLGLFNDLIKGKRLMSDLDEEEQEFVGLLKNQGLILTSIKTATWFLTLRCSLNCVHCYQNLQNREKPLTWTDTKLILTRLIDWRVGHLAFSGGDIFLYDNLFRLLHEIEKNAPEISVSLLTSGYLLGNNTKAQKELKQFRHWKPFVQLSVYSHQAGIHDEITGVKGSFDKTVGSICFLQSIKIPLLVNVVLMQKNFAGRHQLINFLENRLKISRDSINFDTTLFPYVGQSEKEVTRYALSASQLKVLLREEDFAALPVKYLMTTPYCTGARSRMAVSPSGDLYPCNMVQRKLGNVLTTSIQTILDQSRLANDFRKYQNSSCLKCQTKFCKRCQAFTKRQDFDRIYCQYVKIAEKEVEKRIKEVELKGFKRLK